MSDSLTMVSGLDDLFYDVTLADASTNQALAAGAVSTVTVVMCRSNTTSPLGPTATQTLTSQGSGRWTGLHDDSDVLAALTAGGIAIGQRFDLVLQVGTLAVRKLATCQRVAVLDA